VAVTLINSEVSLAYASGTLTTAGLPPALPAARSGRASRPARRAKPATQPWQRVLLWLLLAVVLLAPLPLGSDRPLPASALSAAIGVLLCVWGVVCLVARQPAITPARPLWPAFALFGLAAAWAAAQALPFTPPSLHHPYWSEAREVLGGPYAGAISVNPEATWSRLMGLLAYGGIFWLAFQLCHPSGRAHQVLAGLAAGGLLYAAYGLHDFFASGSGVVTSTFVNRDSYATYAGMTLLCGLGLVLHALARRARPGVSHRRAVVEMLARLDAPLAVGIVTCLVAGAALLLTRSRGAFIALCAALVAFVWSLRRTSLITSQALVRTVTLFATGLLLGIVGLAGGQTLGRFADGDLARRLVYYRATWDAIRDRPLLGTGYGTYADAFRAYNHAGTGTYFLDKAHSTYLQMIMELGWPAAAALYAGIGLLVVRCLHGRSAIYPPVLAACSVLVGVHALVDFSLEMPAVAATYALLLGAGCAQAVQGSRNAP
jgi:O-antigen ligase